MDNNTIPPNSSGEPCKHKHIEFDESTGMAVCSDCWTTMRTKYENKDVTF